MESYPPTQFPSQEAITAYQLLYLVINNQHTHLFVCVFKKKKKDIDITCIYVSLYILNNIYLKNTHYLGDFHIST